MKKSLIHRILLTLILGVFVLASASAQDAVFLVGSTHKASLALHTDNTCEWKVYKVIDFTDTKDENPAAADEFSFKDGIDNAANVEITWKNPGKYYLIVEEFNGEVGECSTRRAFAIQVADNSAIEFAVNTSNDCSDIGSSFTTNLLIETSGIANDKFFPIKVYYSIGGIAVTDPVIVNQDGVIEIIGLTINDEFSESNHIVNITSAKDRYGGDVNITTTDGANLHTRILYALPIVDDITY